MDSKGTRGGRVDKFDILVGYNMVSIVKEVNDMIEQDVTLVAYCGLYCGDCFNRKGEIADLARDLRKKLREAKFDKVSKGLSKYFKALGDYERCYEVLGAMVRLRCNRPCRNGGGNPSCKVRICCQRKNLQGCWECEEFANCSKMDFLKPIHEDANLVNLRTIRTRGIGNFIRGTRRF